MFELQKVNNQYVKKQQVKILFDRIQHTYAELKDENEIAIIEKYGIRTKRFTTAVTSKETC